MDKNLEGEKPSSNNRVVIGEEFKPFDENDFTVLHERPAFHITKIYLSSPDNKGLVNLPIQINTARSNSSVRGAITPFNPEQGYQISYEDLKLETRTSKVKSDPRLNNFHTDIDNRIAPLVLVISSPGELEKLGITFKTSSGIFTHYSFNPEYLSYIKRIRVQVTFPGSLPEIKYDNPDFRLHTSFEARPSPLSLSAGAIRFSNFYPIETGPLPTPDPEESYTISNLEHFYEGFGIFLPEDQEKLKQIVVKFILLSEPLPQVKPEDLTDQSDQYTES